MSNLKTLSELIAEQKKQNKEAFLKLPDKDKNYYYEEKMKRKALGIEEDYFFDNEEE